MRPHHRNAHAGRRDGDLGAVEDLPGLFDHLGLFFVVPVGPQRRVVAEAVERDLIREHVTARLLAVENLAALGSELRHRRGAGTAGGLVGADDYPLDRIDLVQGPDRHDADDGRAVRVRDDAFVLLDLLRVDLGDHQRRRGVHAKRRGIVHDHRARLGRRRSELLAARAAGAEQRDIDACEAVLRQHLNRIFLALEGDFLTLGAAAGKHLERIEREVALFEDTEEFLTDGAGHPCDCQMTSHVHTLLFTSVFTEGPPTVGRPKGWFCGNYRTMYFIPSGSTMQECVF